MKLTTSNPRVYEIEAGDVPVMSMQNGDILSPGDRVSTEHGVVGITDHYERCVALQARIAELEAARHPAKTCEWRLITLDEDGCHGWKCPHDCDHTREMEDGPANFCPECGGAIKVLYEEVGTQDD